MAVDEHAAARGSRRAHEPRSAARSIGAHSADFVWRAGGAVAVATRGRRHRRGDRALLRRARRVAASCGRSEGQTVENVKRVRHAEAERGRGALGATFRCLDFGDYPLEIDRRAAAARSPSAIREFAPDVLVTHTDTDPFNPDHPVAYRPSSARADARRGRRRAERVRDDPPARALPVRAAPARALQLHADDVRRHHAA